MTNDQPNYYLRITSITVNEKNAYELKGNFLDDLHKNAFSELLFSQSHWLEMHGDGLMELKDQLLTMDIFTKGALWDYWKLGSDKVEPTNDETSDLEETDHDDG
ncbi:hypothetical protein Tco_0066657 [Tanacetum coccineum]